MNNKGFSLTELLAVLFLFGIVVSIGLYTTKATLSTTMTTLELVTDNQIFNAAKNYIIEQNIPFNNEQKICVKVTELIEYGYLSNNIDDEIKQKIIQINKDINTKVISKIEYTKEVC